MRSEKKNKKKQLTFHVKTGNEERILGKCNSHRTYCIAFDIFCEMGKGISV